jgi:hypothetical protein
MDALPQSLAQHTSFTNKNPASATTTQDSSGAYGNDRKNALYISLHICPSSSGNSYSYIPNTLPNVI